MTRARRDTGFPVSSSRLSKSDATVCPPGEAGAMEPAAGVSSRDPSASWVISSCVIIMLWPCPTA